MKYYLWIDPWVRKLWYALVDQELNIKDAGIILIQEQKLTRPKYFQRMSQIDEFFTKLLKKYEIASIGIEKLFFTNQNQANAEFVYWIRWALIIKFWQKDIPIIEYSPTEIKKYITGKGNANKELVKTFVQKLYSLQNLPEYDDAADALGIAYLLSRNIKNGKWIC